MISAPYQQAFWPYLATLALIVSLPGCTTLPSWVGGAEPVSVDGDSSIVAFPDLGQLPARPGPPPSAEARSAMVETLETARSQNQQAGENLDSQIETNFEYPSPPDNRD